MLKPQWLNTPSGDELVVLELAHYEALRNVAMAAQNRDLNMLAAVAHLAAVEASFEDQ